MFDVNPDFSDSYTQALLIGMHEDGQADACTMFLYNVYSLTKEFIQGALSSLSFVQ